jgi:hypothetical protein
MNGLLMDNKKDRPVDQSLRMSPMDKRACPGGALGLILWLVMVDGEQAGWPAGRHSLPGALLSVGL